MASAMKKNENDETQRTPRTLLYRHATTHQLEMPHTSPTAPNIALLHPSLHRSPVLA